MKKKIAILTQPLGVNYGGILQNYALQTVLKRLGHHPVTLNRWSNYNIAWWKMQRYYLKLHHVFYKDNFKFIKKHLHLTNKLDSDRKFYNHTHKNKYDAFIVGSDQTWRPDYSPNIYNYYLDFLDGQHDIKKIAYATSFGTSEWNYQKYDESKIKLLAKQFHAVSVREDSGVNLCKNYLNIEASHVLDPTMLLTKEDYRKLYKNKIYQDRKGIFVYVLDKTDNKEAIIRKVSQEKELDIFINQPLFTKKGEKTSVKNRIYPPLETWVKAFDDADFIITDSFHGTVFSILYQKPFFAIPNQVRGVARFTSLLKPLGLENRIINSVDDISEELLNRSIDYDKVFKSLKEMQLKSLEFLTKALQ